MMSGKTTNSTGWAVVRGGQTTLHAIRMAVQVLKQFGKLVLFCFLVIYLGIAYYITTPDERYFGGKWLFAYVEYAKLDNKEMLINIELDGVERKVKAYQILHSKKITTKWIELKNKMYVASLYTIFVGGAFFYFLCIYVYRKGREQGEDEHLRGSKLVSTLQLIQVVRKKKLAGKIKVADVPLPVDTVTANTGMIGGMKSGKSQAINELLRGVRRSKNRAVIYDVTGDYVRYFYNPETDIILNPLDNRMPKWDVWAEIKNDWDYTSICETLIPDAAAGSDPFWMKGARIVLEELMKKVGKTTRSNKDLFNKINRISTDEIVAYIQDTDARVLLDKGAEKVTISIRGLMVTYTRILKYLPENGDYFSLRNWVLDENQKGWIFISTKEEQKSALKPLITCWMEIASSTILSLKPDRNRRIWYVFDELPTLNKVPSILNTLTNARKYGGCGVIGFQNYPQIKEIYGDKEGDAITEACTNLLVLRANGEVSAEWASKQLKAREILQANESLSFGAHEMRDGVSINKQRKIERLVLATEIQDLDDLNGYLRLGGHYPVGIVKVKYHEMKEVAKEFIMRPGVGEVELAEICNQSYERGIDKSTGELERILHEEATGKQERVDPHFGSPMDVGASGASGAAESSFRGEQSYDDAYSEYAGSAVQLGEVNHDYSDMPESMPQDEEDSSESVYDYSEPLQ